MKITTINTKKICYLVFMAGFILYGCNKNKADHPITKSHPAKKLANNSDESDKVQQKDQRQSDPNLQKLSNADLKKQCRKNNGDACEQLAWRFQQDHKTVQATRWYKRACFLHQPAACHHLAELAKIANNKILRIDALEEACRFKYPESCTVLDQEKPKIKISH